MTADEELTGGVSSDIRIRQTAEGPIVLKRALDRLKVTADWRANPDRSHIEVRALRVAAALIGQEHVPTVLWEDRSQHLFAMTLADPALENWKLQLIRGLVDLETAAAVGRTLALLHRKSAEDEAIARAFEDRGSFQELRIEPFFTSVSAKYPNLKSAIDAVVDTMSSRRSALIHGDFSPKNLLVKGSRVVVLDFEVAHWGDPAFDLGFCCAHLLLKKWRRGADGEAFAAAIRTLLAGYADGFGGEPLDDHLTRMTACLLLARTDGASPVDYEADLDLRFVRNTAIGWLQTREVSIAEAIGTSDCNQS